MDPGTVTVLADGDTTYHLVGTAHVSDKSVQEVREIILRLRPEVVCVELCQGRFDALTQDRAFRDLDVFKVIREGRTLYLLAHLALAGYQKRMGAALGVKPGAELIAAIEAAKEVGARVELVDRDIHVTLKRTWANLGLWKKSQLMASLVVGFGDDEGEEVTADKIEQLKEHKALSEMMSELARALPQIKTPLIDERDAFLMSSIEDAGKGHHEVVAVVGAAHVAGMKTHFNQPVDRATLNQPPKPSWFWTALKWLVPILMVVGLIVGAQYSSRPVGEVILTWALTISACAAAATLLTGGKLVSVLTAFVVAPICAIHPLLGTAMFTGFTEAWLRKPTVRDCEDLPEAVTSFRAAWKNPVTRILLVATASGLGTAAGAWIGTAWVLSM
jgi:pheromone shutdown-related protein TraB